MKTTIIAILTLFLSVFCAKACPSPDNNHKEIREVPFTHVRFTDDFWLPRMEVNRTVSIPSAFRQCEQNGRFDNFAIAGGLLEGEHQGDFSFDDTDPYKVIEGASYSLALKYDPALDAYLDSVIVLIAAAQEPDGYLTTCVTNRCTRLSGWWGNSRWEKINSHELYNCGHLYEAAVAHYQATGKRSLIDVAVKNADLVCGVFGLGEGQVKYPSGHPIIEMALVKLYKVTGDKKYLAQARYFVDEAGRLSNGREPGIYSQDHKPVLEQDEIVGHAVRAGYFYSGVADVASLQQDAELFEAVERVWNNMASRKLYLNGGIGSRPQGEGFGPDYELNNFSNYCETCASIANVYWNHRMFLATGNSKYVDVLERTLYNGLIAGVSLDGDKFFYDNPMASTTGHHRQPWFGCACCPGNVTRFMASVPLYNYATQGNDIFVNLYVAGSADIKTGKGEVKLTQTTDYPWDGDVRIEVQQVTGTRNFALKLRIPSWAKGYPVPSDLYQYVDGADTGVTVSLNGKKIDITRQDGYAVVERKWKKGDRVDLHFKMPVRRVQAHPAVKYDRGLLAMERGPIVYALESIDQGRSYIFDIVIPRETKITGMYEPNLLGGVVSLTGEAFIAQPDGSSLPAIFKAIPYSTWNNRGYGKMVVWTPETAAYALPQSEPTIASRARSFGGWGFNDQIDPKSSNDTNSPYHYWWLKAGTEETAGYTFQRPEKIAGVDVYWLAFDHYDVVYRAPESWKLQYLDGEEWKDIEGASGYGRELDRYNRVTFPPVITTGLRIVAQLQRPKSDGETPETGPQIVDPARRGYSAGIIEWKVF